VLVIDPALAGNLVNLPFPYPSLARNRGVHFVTAPQYLEACALESKLIDPAAMGMEIFADGVMVLADNSALLHQV
jgi:hypothetical protein